MRRQSATLYIKNILDTTSEVVQKIETFLDENNEVDDLLELCLLWALESISGSFLDTNLGCFAENLSLSSDAMRFVDALKIGLGDDLTELALGPPVWKMWETKSYKRFNQAAETVNELTSKMVDKAKIGSYNNSGKQGSILQKLLTKCGPDSPIPLLMCQDALTAGVDTTGTTAAFLLLDLARNKKKQEILYREIREHIEEEEVTELGLSKMKYLKACLHESQRLNSPINALSRRTQEDTTIGGFEVPRGVNVR